TLSELAKITSRGHTAIFVYREPEGEALNFLRHCGWNRERVFKMTMTETQNNGGRGVFSGCVGICIFLYLCLENFFYDLLITNDLKATKGCCPPFKPPLAMKLALALANRRSSAYGSDR